MVAFRRINEQLESLEFATGGKDSNLITHGNRFLAYAIYHRLFGRTERNVSVDDATLKKTAADSVQLLSSAIANNYPDNYVASLFKNQSKCRELAALVAAGLKDNNQPKRPLKPEKRVSRARPSKESKVK